MPRRRAPSRRVRPLPPLAGPPRVETGPDGHQYEVRPVAAARAVKAYRCPGCDHEIRSGTAHLVVWPADSTLGGGPGLVEDRRHWHTPCWTHRSTRGPTRKWS
ncbi:hypothetical protein [Mycobacterium sp. Marseille-P9652]|uniref:hypothetical protein n=1 Tax=Mycobacterium sp. Marseille-P9652 TaxID=2654950 RepID=UPI0012E9245F|nr:hypothetical protein [Mycobacterium sp. Marseille-P9652]